MLLTGSTTDLKRHNRDAVLRFIRQCGTASRTEITESIGLTNAAVSRITRELIDIGLVEEGERIELPGQSGRRQVTLRIKREGAYVIGIAVTLNAREIVIADARGEIVERKDCSDISLDQANSALKEFAVRAKALFATMGVSKNRLIGGAASVAGRVSPADGSIMGADPLDWDGQRVAASFTDLLGLPFVSEGRAAALLRAERDQGQAMGLEDVLLVNVGLKLGAAMMLDGMLLRGARNEAFMLNKYAYARGRFLDDTASGFAVLFQLNEAGHQKSEGIDPGSYLRQLVDDPERLDTVGRNVFRKSGCALGEAIAQLAPILSPQLVILAGIVTRQQDYIAGVEEGLGQSSLAMSQSRFTTAQSAIHLALEHHLFAQASSADGQAAA